MELSSTTLDGRQQIISADHVIAIADQIGQNVEDLWLRGDQIHASPQLAPVAIDRAAVKREHIRPPGATWRGKL